MLIVASNVAVDLLMDASTDIRLGLLANNIGVDVLADVNVNVSAGVMTAFEFAMSGRPLKEFDCRPMTALDCASVLQTCIPSYHV